jgi:hypothetical protein
MVALVVLVQASGAEPVKHTPFSINDPFEIPSMILEPGHYVFKLVDREPQRNVLDVFETVQLWTGDETRLLSTLLTMPNYDQPTTDKTVFTFFERGPKQPKALRIWFAPGRNYGQEFVYPKLQAVELAKSVGRAVLSLPPELPGDLGKLASAAPQPNPAPPAPPPIPAVRPTAIPTALTPTVKAPAPIQSRARVREPQMMAASLPKTASYMALFAAVGVMGIFAGALLRILALPRYLEDYPAGEIRYPVECLFARTVRQSQRRSALS